MKQLWIPLFLVFIVGCSHKSKKSAQNVKEKKVFETSSSSPTAPVAKNTLKPVKKKMSDQEMLQELTGKRTKNQSEGAMYLQIANAFQAKKPYILRTKAREFMVRFPKSTLMDNVLYVSGLSEMESSQYLEALKYFQRIEKEYPKGDRAAAARLSKALMYKRMNLVAQSESNLKSVRSNYPGSPEAYRAEAELKILK